MERHHIEEIIERAIRDWAGLDAAAAAGFRYAVLHDLATNGYEVRPIQKPATETK